MKQLRGRSYIESPEKLKNAKVGIINIRNEDNECFKWCILYHQSIKGDNCERISKLKKIQNKYNMNNIFYPAGYDDIETFETNNNNTQINIFNYDEEKDNINILRKSNTKGHDIINLLLIKNEEKEHYIYIKNISSLLRNNKEHSKITCEKCFRALTAQQMKTHINCENESIEEFKTIITFPEEKERLKFKDYNKMLKQPFVIYADFESTLQPQNNNTLIQKHLVNSYGLKLVCSFDNKYTKDIELYRGPNAVNNFISRLFELKDETQDIINNLREQYENPILTNEEEQHFNNQSICYLCNIIFNETSGKNRDHCHLTGKYRGALCSKCNINYHKKNELIVIFHNLRNYDGHFIIQEASKYTDKIRVINQSFEKYMMFSFCDIKFIDSFQFLSESLDTLSKNLITKDYQYFNHTKKYFNNFTELMCRKGIYPYEFVINENVFNLDFPTKDKFYSKLTNEHIKDIDYEHALNVYRIMNCHNFGDYHDLYLKCDVLILCDVFENFRNSAMEKYKLDPCNFITSPSLAWSAMLSSLNPKLGYLHNEDELNFLNKRGGIVQAGGQRHVKANNKYMNNYDSSKPSSYISYLDMNNLYGCAMSDYLPYEIIGFDNNIKLEDILNTPINNDIGYFVEVDIHLPNELHNKFKDYPLFPENKKVDYDKLSDYQKSILKQNNKNYCNSNKLILDLEDKKNMYVIIDI
jgi:hypothetical protein